MQEGKVYWCVVLSTTFTWIFAVVAAASDTWFEGSDLRLGGKCDDGGAPCAIYATPTAFQIIATLACSVAVLLLYLSAFAPSYFNPLVGQAPPWRSGQVSQRELRRAGVWGLLVFTVAEVLVFIVMSDLRKRAPTTGFSCDGILKGDVCCAAGCGECGGVGCSDRGGGLNADDCCVSNIQGAGSLCSLTGEAPCLVDGALGRGAGYNCAIAATVFAILQAIILSGLQEHGTTLTPGVGRYCTVYNAYHAVIATTFLITWPFAIEGAAGNQWITVPVELTLGGTCRDYGNSDFCPGYYAATFFQYLATLVCSCAVVALALATVIERPELVNTGAWGLLCYAATQALAFAIVAGIKDENLTDEGASYGDTFAVAVTSVFVAAAQQAFGIFRLHPKCRIHGPMFARFGPQQNGFQSTHFLTSAASSVITFLFSVIIAAYDGWFSDRDVVHSDCTNSDDEHCGTYKAAVALQKFATCSCSLAFAVLGLPAITPIRTRETSFVWATYLGAMGGCLLVLYALAQLVVLCIMSWFRNRYFHSIRYGPVHGLALFTSILAAVQGCVVLLSFRAVTRNGRGVGFTVRSSRVHVYISHEPYWTEMEMGQETKSPDGNHDHAAGFIVRHPKAGTNFGLVRLASDSQRFEFLANQFRECWRKGKAPDVSRIYEIQLNEDLQRKIDAYQSSKGNICVAYHGTRCHPSCDFFVREEEGPCGRQTCSVCSICMKGFTEENMGRTARASSVQLRYGDGRYFSRASGKAHDYSKTKTTARGGSLNYDEVVVYDDSAARPTHLISYSFGD